MNTNSKSPGSKWSSVWVYFAVAYGVSWLIEIALALSGVSMEAAYSPVLLSLAVLGPATAAIGLTYLTQDKMGRRDYWLRIIDIRRISLRWYLVIFLLPAALMGLAALLDFLLGGRGWTFGAQVRQFSANPFYLIIILFLAPFLEEFGWRGYALDRLQLRWNALVSSLILGFFWALWHLPIFFIKGTYQYTLGVGSLAFWTFMISVIPLTFLFTWIFNNNGRSTLSAILLHIMFDTTAEVFSVTERAYTYFVVLEFVAAIAITMIWGAKTLKRQDKDDITVPLYPQMGTK
ncbi:CAAX prenyl protease 2 [uncultured archaeon]|nr:CAAX prenyl protease 2 [uncultured archaeon]